MKKKNFLITFIKTMFVTIFFFYASISVFNTSLVYADPPRSITQPSGSSDAGTMWQQATKWFKGVNKDDNSSQAVEIINEFVDMVNVIGTTVIVIATIILGIKYIFGSVDSKADVKESLITLFVACIFFFGWTAIKNVLFPSNQFALT